MIIIFTSFLIDKSDYLKKKATEVKASVNVTVTAKPFIQVSKIVSLFMNSSKPKTLVMRKIFTLIVLLFATGQLVTAQNVTSTIVSWKDMVAYEAANPDAIKYCKTCPKTEADKGWLGINAANMPIPPGANIKRQGNDKGPAVDRPGPINPPMIPSRPPLQDFLGHLDPGNTIPPDTHGAVGLNHVITATNDFIKIHNKIGGAQVSQVSISTFTAVPSTCDPYMLFDPTSQRWMFSAIGCAGVNNPMILMVSNTADPTGTWRKITWVPAGPSMLLDHPYLGFDNQTITLSGRRFQSGTTFVGSSLFLVDKAAMLAGTAITFGTNAQQIDKTTVDGDSPCPVTLYEPPFSTVGNPSPGTSYVLQSWSGAASSIRLTTVTGTIPTATWNTTTAVFPSGGTPWNSGALNNAVEQMVETRRLAANDARISSAVMMNGKIWCSHHIGFPTSGLPDRIAAQWWQLDGAAGAGFGNVLQRGRVGGTVAGEYKWFTGIAVNKDEDVILGYSASTTTSRVGAAYTTRQATTPANTMDDELIYHGGQDRYWKDFGSGRARWGDYTHSSLDPVDNSIWTIQQYAAPGNGPIPPDNNSRSGVWWAQVPASNSPAAPVITAGPTAITAESCTPANNAIDPAETVTVSFALQNVGTGPTTNLVGTLLATGGVTAPSAPQNYGVVVDGGPAVSRSFTFTATGTCGGGLVASIQLQDGAANLGTLTYNFTLGTLTATFTENFDAVAAPALPAGWVATNAAGAAPLWVTATGTVVSAPNSIFVDDPGTVSDKIIETPSIAIASAMTQLTFRNNFILEGGFDGGVLEISINGGAYVDIITAGGSWVVGGYNGTISGSFSNPLANRAAWTGNGGGYITTTVNLPAAAVGQNVKFRFRMGSDTSVSGTGWNIDNVSMSAPTCCAACIPPSVATQPGNTSVCPTGNATFTVVAGGTGPFTYQWEESPTGAGGPWANVTNGGIYSGATTASLTLTGVTAPMNGYAYRVVITGNCGSPATSNAAVLTIVATSVGGTVTPANSVVCSLPNTGVLTLSGHSGAVLNWESSTVAVGGPYTLIAGTAGQTTLTFNNLTVTTYYRAVVQAAGCIAANSSVATVTANTSPLLIVAVPGTILCEGDPAALTVYNTSGTNPVALTQSSSTTITSGNSVACNAGGLHTDNSYWRAYNLAPMGLPAPLTINTVTFGIELASGAPQPVTVNLYTQNAGPAFPGGTRTLVGTQNFTIPAQSLSLFTGAFVTPVTVPNNAVLIVELFTPSGQGSGNGFFIGSNAAAQTGTTYLSAAACGIVDPTDIAVIGFPNMHIILNVAGTVPAPAGIATGTFLWSPAAGLSSTTTNPVAASPMNTTTYTVVNNDGAGCIRQASVTLTVNKRPTVTVQPANRTNCALTSATFTVAGTGTNLTYQWQESTTGPGGPWTTLTNTAPYSGVNTATLTVNPVTIAMNGNQYRCVLSGTCPAVGTANISTGAILTVNALPVVTVTPTSGCGGVKGINGLLLTASGASSYTWAPLAGLYTNANTTTAYTGGNAATVYAAPTAYTAYTVTGTNAATCINTAVALVNYTPPAPTITPSAVAMCLGDPAVRLTSSSAVTSTATFQSAALSLAVPDFTPNGVNTNIAVSGIPAGATVTGVRVTWNMTHTWNGDMVFVLREPASGRILNLDYFLSSSGGAGATTGFVNTAVGSTGTAALSSGTGTYTGLFRADAIVGNGPFGPSGPTGFDPTVNSFNALISGINPNGNWTLAMYDGGPGDLGVLTSWNIQITYVVGVPSTAATWSPIAGLFTDPAALNAYTGTAVDTVYARPTPSGVYPYQATVQSLPPTPSVPQTNFATGNGQALVTFNVRNNNAFSVTLTDIASAHLNAGAATVTAFYKTTAINGAPGAISAANGWTQFGTGTANIPAAVTITPSLSGLNLVIPAGATYGIAFQSLTAANGANVSYSTLVAGTYTFSSGGCDIIAGTNISYGGVAAPGAPGFTPRGFIGNVSLVPSVTACTSPAKTVVVTVNQPTSIVTQPVNRTICTDKVATFTVIAGGSGPFSYQWQVSTNSGNTYNPVSNGGVYSGATSATLTITQPPVSMSGYFYRCVVTGAAPCASITSAQRMLTVNPLPNVVITASPYVKLYPGLVTTLSSVVTPNAAAPGGYTWLRNGAPVAGANTGTLSVDVDRLGDYTLTVTDVNGCTNTSNLVSITDSVTSRCYIYPNPNSGQFQVRYYSAANNVLPRTLTVYDGKGDRVLTQNYTIGRPYDRMDVDMRKFGKGLYWVEIGDVNGNRLTMCRIVIQ